MRVPSAFAGVLALLSLIAAGCPKGGSDCVSQSVALATGYVKPNRALDFWRSVETFGGRNRSGYLFGPGDWPLMKPDKIKKPDAFRVKAKVTCAQAQKPLLVDAVPRDSDGNLYPKRLAGFIQMLGATTLG